MRRRKSGGKILRCAQDDGVGALRMTGPESVIRHLKCRITARYSVAGFGDPALQLRKQPADELDGVVVLEVFEALAGAD